ncbi:tetratricopeptide repeat protein [Streptomyces polyrhachis]|uniref:Tetratricopeptide repeat protein n=1 Tax=Streptomyces polyrhachis TaxID=1282885 RepID=A0ABW2GKB8_9ACTN
MTVGDRAPQGTAGAEARRLVAEGRALLGQGRHAEALGSFQEVCRLDGACWEGWYWSGCAAAHAGEHAAAVAHFTAALERDATLGRAYVQRAYARLRCGETGAARADLLAAARHRGLDDDARWVSALLQLNAGEWATAELSFTQLLPRAGARAGLARTLVAYAQERRGLPQAALASYEQLASDGAASVDDAALHRHALLARRLERHGESAALWRQLAARRPDLPQVGDLAAGAARLASREAARDRDYATALRLLAPDGELPEGVGAGAAEGAPDADDGVYWLSEPGPDEARGEDGTEVYWLSDEDDGPDEDSTSNGGGMSAAQELAELRLHAAWQAVAGGGGGEEDRAQARELLREACLDQPLDPRPLYYLALLAALDGERAQAALLWRRVLRLRPEDRRARLALALLGADGGDAAETAQAAAELTELAAERDPRLGGRERAALALAALQLRAGRWQDAGRLLAPLPPGPLREALAEEVAHRSGSLDAEPGSTADPHRRAVALCRAGHHRTAAKALRGAGPAPDVRTERELARLLRTGALHHAAEERYAEAAQLLGSWGPSTVGDPLDALLLLLGGRREAAVDLLADAVRRSPGDPRLAHTLAVASLSVPAPSPAQWRRCLAAWSAVLHREDFLARVRQEAEARYGTPVSGAAVEAASGRLREALEDLLPAEGEARLLLRRETDGAQALRDCGGLPLPEGGTLVCGPLWIEELGLGGRLSAYVAARPQDEATERLRLAFSTLGLPGARLRAGRMREALDSLADVRCPLCRTRPAPPSLRGRPVECAAGCAGFAAANPAYAELADGRRLFGQDAAALAMEAGLALGASALAGSEPDVAAATTHWRGAVDRAQEVGREARAQGRIAEAAAARAEEFARAEDFDAAVMLLDFAQVFTTGEEHERVCGRLAAQLTARAVHTVNERRGSAESAIADLRRAVTLNPHLLRAQASLAIVRSMQATVLLKSGQTVQAVLTLRTSVAELAEALGYLPENRELSELHDKASERLAQLLPGLVPPPPPPAP